MSARSVILLARNAKIRHRTGFFIEKLLYADFFVPAALI
jgi:hypothetical protein